MATSNVGNVYTTPTEAISAAAQAEVLALIDLVIALIPNPAYNATSSRQGTGGHYLDEMAPVAAEILRNELATLKVAIDAAPTA